MTPQRIQSFIALVFFILGGWAALFPQHVIDTVFLPEYREGGRILPFATACFGAQALLSGLFAAFSRFTSLTFMVYGIALLPFFAFNYYFTFHDPVFTSMGLLDAVGNVIMLVLCYIGWKKSKAVEQGIYG
jgi:hypothetical protein|tara:strand:- start:2873 stop:3265 length:393 start_codon:yes stop_codon:yes gene_type:complete